jgi:dATP pyrophosphohydrolase
LLLHRIPSREGFWQGVSGGVEQGEALAEAAHRELLEETGFVPCQLQQIDCSYSFSMQDEWRALYAPGVEEIKEYVFLACVNAQEPRLDPAEHDQWRWCRFDEALKLLTWPENKEALRRCHEALLERGDG